MDVSFILTNQSKQLIPMIIYFSSDTSTQMSGSKLNKDIFHVHMLPAFIFQSLKRNKTKLCLILFPLEFLIIIHQRVAIFCLISIFPLLVCLCFSYFQYKYKPILSIICIFYSIYIIFRLLS